jgi:predicted NBD/HSP70 family sugar kinase
MPHRILQLIRTSGPFSRAELARRTGLSKPTVSSLAAELLASGLIVETGLAQSEGGRRPVLLAFNDRAGFVIGMDVGGTTARACLATLQGEVLATVREQTAGSSSSFLTAQLRGLTEALCAQAQVPRARVLGVAIGTPGAVDPGSNRVRYAPNLSVLETPGFADALASALGLPVSLHNDVNLAAVGEQAHGAGQGTYTFVFVSIGTGLGFGLVVGGRLHRGEAGRAGELGYLRLSPHDPKTIEEVLCGAGIARRHAEAGGSGRVSDAFDEAEGGRDPGLGVITELFPYLAWLLSALGTLLDPERLILGGGIGQRFAAFAPQLTRSLAQLSPITPPLSFSALGDDAGLHGAVRVALSEAELHLVQSVRKGGEESIRKPVATLS